VQASRLKELKAVVKEITDENVIIIEGIYRYRKNLKRGSKFRGVSKNGKKWQVSHSFSTHLLLLGDGDGQHEEVLLRFYLKRITCCKSL
jgi:hypothetical protein